MRSISSRAFVLVPPKEHTIMPLGQIEVPSILLSNVIIGQTFRELPLSISIQATMPLQSTDICNNFVCSGPPEVTSSLEKVIVFITVTCP